LYQNIQIMDNICVFDASTIDSLNQQAWRKRFINHKEAFDLANQAYQLATESGYTQGSNYSRLLMAVCNFFLTTHHSSIRSELLLLVDSFKAENQWNAQAVAFDYLAQICDNLGDYDRAMRYATEALNLAVKQGDKELESDVATTMGKIYSRLNDYKTAVEMLKRGEKLRSELNDYNALASSLNLIARNYSLSGDYPNALHYFNRSIEMRKKYHPESLVWSYLGLAGYYRQVQNYSEAIKYYQIGLKLISGEDFEKRGQFIFLLELGSIYTELYEFEEAEKFLKKALEYIPELSSKPLEYQIYKALSELYEAKADFKPALDFFKRYHAVKNEVTNAEINQLKKIEIQNAYNEIEQKNIEITQKNRDITESIEYARRIQTALLPPGDYISEFAPERFILFKPRDIVSGDFYWVGKKENKIVIVAADCTGHGVPGAFMSMLGVAFLNQIVNTTQNLSAGNILNQLRMTVISSLRQTGKDHEAKDGMDIALCIMDLDAMKLEFAGANNPMYFIRNNELQIFKGDKMPIGIHYNMQNSFATHTLSIKKGDVFYLFSDGYIDQFGGENERKFMSSRFKELLLSINAHSMEKQHKILDETIENWRHKHSNSTEKYPQTDDILVIGIRI